MNHPQLEKLRIQYPLPPAWPELEVYSEVVQVGDMVLELAGLHASGDLFRSATGSAAGESGGELWVRAYFELLERVSIVEATRAEPSTHFFERDLLGNKVSEVPRVGIYDVNKESQSWRLSLSNGVSSHTQWGLAASSAIGEAVERDAILFSWFGGPAPKAKDLPDYMRVAEEKLKGIYEFKLYEFKTRFTFLNFETPFHVFAVFALPRAEGPVIYGFGAKTSVNGAVLHAYQECLQRLGFLWGEEVSDEEPVFTPTAEYHQEIFLRKAGRKLIEEWLDGRYQSQGQIPGSAVRSSQLRFFDITLPEHHSKIAVVKVVAQDTIPLVFGCDYASALQMLDADSVRTRFIHPIV